MVPPPASLGQSVGTGSDQPYPSINASDSPKKFRLSTHSSFSAVFNKHHHSKHITGAVKSPVG